MISYLEPIAQEYLPRFRGNYFSRDAPLFHKQSASVITIPLDEVSLSPAANRILEQAERLKKIQLETME